MNLTQVSHFVKDGPSTYGTTTLIVVMANGHSFALKEEDQKHFLKAAELYLTYVDNKVYLEERKDD